MDSRLSLGLFIGFMVSGFTTLIASEGVAIGILVFGSLWGILLINPKSRMRRSCLSVSNRLTITVEAYANFPPSANRQYVTVYETLRTLAPIRVDQIRLCIHGKTRLPRNWESHTVTPDEPGGYIYFDRPHWLPNGKHPARLIAYTPDGYSKSEEFTLEATN